MSYMKVAFIAIVAVILAKVVLSKVAPQFAAYV